MSKFGLQIQTKACAHCFGTGNDATAKQRIGSMYLHVDRTATGGQPGAAHVSSMTIYDDANG